MPEPGQVNPAQRFRRGCPHITADGAGQVGTHSQRRVVVLQVRFGAHSSPTPHSGPPGQTFAMLVPQAIVLGFTLGHRGAHAHRPAVHTSPVAQRVPTPGHATSTHALGTELPHATVLGSAQRETHSHRPLLQRCPVGQKVPRPQSGSPPQRLRIASPHATAPGSTDGQPGTHSQRPAAQRSPARHRVPVPAQGDAVQPLRIGSPQSTSSGCGHAAMHPHRPVALSHRSPLAQRDPTPQVGPPAHSFGTTAPHATSRTAAGSGQRGMHSQRRAPVSQR